MPMNGKRDIVSEEVAESTDNKTYPGTIHNTEKERDNERRKNPEQLISTRWLKVDKKRQIAQDRIEENPYYHRGHLAFTHTPDRHVFIRRPFPGLLMRLYCETLFSCRRGVHIICSKVAIAHHQRWR